MSPIPFHGRYGQAGVFCRANPNAGSRPAACSDYSLSAGHGVPWSISVTGAMPW